MKRIEITDEKLNQIIKLRESGKNWTEIERETEVKRRIAQARYNEVKRSRNLEELKIARERVAGEALNEHIKNLLEMAEFLAINLDIPQSHIEYRNADEYINSLLERDIFLNSDGIFDKDESRRKMRYLLSEKKSLLNSLRKHTPGKRWEAYDNWVKAWNSSIFTLKQLQREAYNIANALLDNHPKAKEISKVVNNTKQVGEWIGKNAIVAIWKSAIKSKSASNNYEITINSDLIEDNEPQEIIQAINQAIKDRAIQARQSVSIISQAVIDNLCRGDSAGLVQELSSSIHTMESALDELVRGLNRHILRAEISLSRCELCPA